MRWGPFSRLVFPEVVDLLCSNLVVEFPELGVAFRGI
jgi:hypothetical protein